MYLYIFINVFICIYKYIYGGGGLNSKVLIEESRNPVFQKTRFSSINFFGQDFFLKTWFIGATKLDKINEIHNESSKLT